MQSTPNVNPSTISQQTQPATMASNRLKGGNCKFNVVLHGIDECSKGTPRHMQTNYEVTTTITKSQ